ncbi:hypothetical protein KC878_03395 [Candidatus Saccharibacteria bacterium]|nr:hypothetical protein [Candidatus Saccharibacteria bacterium]MCB9820981.1 hypothetical protein [Candidatus Nomurabacteria bacterium]
MTSEVEKSSKKIYPEPQRGPLAKPKQSYLTSSLPTGKEYNLRLSRLLSIAVAIVVVVLLIFMYYGLVSL